MSTAMGTNVKVIVSASARPRVRAMFEAIGLEAPKSPAEHLDVFALHDGGNLGFCFVPAEEALGEEELARSVWLELRVGDVDAVARALDAQSIPRVEYSDTTHPYFRAPGGLVFRLARLG